MNKLIKERRQRKLMRKGLTKANDPITELVI